MDLHGFFFILYTVLYIFEVCDSKCDEYVILFQELSCKRAYQLKPIKLDDISWKDLTYPYNTTEVCDEVQGYKECILEFDCNGNVATCLDIAVAINNSIHVDNNTLEGFTEKTEIHEKPKVNIVESEKPNKIVSEEMDDMIMDINIIYINENNIQNTSGFTKKTTKNHNQVQCDYAETICISEKQLDNSSLSNEENGINQTRHHETTRTLVITLQRDLTTAIQPIFTGYFPQSLEALNYTKADLSEFKTVTLTCKLLEDNNCRQNISNESNMQINVYLKTNYIKNNTTTKYPNCTKNFSTINNSLNLKCDAKDFAKNNKQILLAPLVTNKTVIKPENKKGEEILLMGAKDLLICKCQIATELNNIHTNEANIISFKNCSNYRNINNKTNSGDLNKTLINNNKNGIIDKITTTNSTTELNKKLNKDHLSSINEENIITIRITENGDNCSHSSPFSIDVGKIIDLETINSKKKILENNNVVLNISNCINMNSTELKTTEIQTEMAIVLKNDSLNTSELYDKTPEEAGLKQQIILKCDPPYLNPDSSEANVNKTILECEFIYLKDLHNITGVVNTIENKDATDAKEITKEKINTDSAEKYHNETIINTEINTDEPEKNISTLNETVDLKEHNHNNNTRNDNTTTDVENKVIGNDSLIKGNSILNTFNRKKDLTKQSGQNSLDIESDGPEKAIIIILSLLAGACILVIFTLHRCSKKEAYHPTPTREAPDEEDTAL